MTKRIKIVISVIMIILGWVLNACAWTFKIISPINTICLLFGLVFFIGGFLFLIWLRKKQIEFQDILCFHYNAYILINKIYKQILNN